MRVFTKDIKINFYGFGSDVFEASAGQAVPDSIPAVWLERLINSGVIAVRSASPVVETKAAQEAPHGHIEIEKKKHKKKND